MTLNTWQPREPASRLICCSKSITRLRLGTHRLQPADCFVLAIVEKVVVAQDRLLCRSQALSDQALRPIGGGECSSCTRTGNERATDPLVAQQQLELLVSNLISNKAFYGVQRALFSVLLSSCALARRTSLSVWHWCFSDLEDIRTRCCYNPTCRSAYASALAPNCARANISLQGSARFV